LCGNNPALSRHLEALNAKIPSGARCQTHSVPTAYASPSACLRRSRLCVCLYLQVLNDPLLTLLDAISDGPLAVDNSILLSPTNSKYDAHTDLSQTACMPSYFQTRSPTHFHPFYSATVHGTQRSQMQRQPWIRELVRCFCPTFRRCACLWWCGDTSVLRV